MWQYRNQSDNYSSTNGMLQNSTNVEYQKSLIARLGQASILENFLWIINRYHREHEPPVAAQRLIENRMQTMFQRINFIFWLTSVTGLMAALVASIVVSLIRSCLAGLYHQVKPVEDEADVISPA